VSTELINGSLRFDTPIEMNNFVDNNFDNSLKEKAYISSTDPVIIFRGLSKRDYKSLMEKKVGRWHKEINKLFRGRIIES